MAELRQISQKVAIDRCQNRRPERDDFREIQQQSEAAIQYYNCILARPRPRRANAPAIAQTVAQRRSAAAESDSSRRSSSCLPRRSRSRADNTLSFTTRTVRRPHNLAR